MFASNRDASSEWVRSDLYVLNGDGTVERITNALQQIGDEGIGVGYSEPAWSPDGTKIAATRQEGSTTEIVVMDDDGSNQQIVSYAGEGHAGTASWSPDGLKIVHDGTDFPGLKVVDNDGSNPTIIPNIEADGQGFGFSMPDWSPDGSKFSFSYYPTDQSIRVELCIIDIDGTDLVQVTDAGTDVTESQWSPGGNEIAVTVGGRACSGRIAVVAPVASSNPEVLAASDCLSSGPSWSSDGSKLAFADMATAEFEELWVVNRDHTDLRRLRFRWRTGRDGFPGETPQAGTVPGSGCANGVASRFE